MQVRSAGELGFVRLWTRICHALYSAAHLRAPRRLIRNIQHLQEHAAMRRQNVARLKCAARGAYIAASRAVEPHTKVERGSAGCRPILGVRELPEAVDER
eukprot:3573752-Prymnesium_polylepis.1